jgi:hypothetical protein
LKILDLARLFGPVFSARFRKILKIFELLDPVAEQSSQNIDSLRLTSKIFFSKNLAGGANVALCASRRCHHRRLRLWMARADVTWSCCGKVLGGRKMAPFSCCAFTSATKTVVDFWGLTERGLKLCVGVGAVPPGLIAIFRATQDLRPGLTDVAAPRLGFGALRSTAVFSTTLFRKSPHAET